MAPGKSTTSTGSAIAAKETLVCKSDQSNFHRASVVTGHIEFMKHVHTLAKRQVIISDAAMERARRAMTKVAYSSIKVQQTSQAARKLPEIAVMAGRKRGPVAERKQEVTA